MPCCVHCHHNLVPVAIEHEQPIAYLCMFCFSIWQLNIGYNPWINQHDPEILEPRFA